MELADVYAEEEVMFAIAAQNVPVVLVKQKQPLLNTIMLKGSSDVILDPFEEGTR